MVKMPPKIEQKLKALDSFKDWGNYLLLTTVAALGWTTAKDAASFSSPWIKDACILLFAISVVFAILTLALIPHVAENITEDVESFTLFAGRDGSTAAMS